MILLEMTQDALGDDTGSSWRWQRNIWKWHRILVKMTVSHGADSYPWKIAHPWGWSFRDKLWKIKKKFWNSKIQIVKCILFRDEQTIVRDEQEKKICASRVTINSWICLCPVSAGAEQPPGKKFFVLNSWLRP